MEWDLAQEHMGFSTQCFEKQGTLTVLPTACHRHQDGNLPSSVSDLIFQNRGDPVKSSPTTPPLGTSIRVLAPPFCVPTCAFLSPLPLLSLPLNFPALAP